MILFVVLVILVLITTFTEHFIDKEINQCPLQILKQKGKYNMINDRNKFYIPNQNPKVVNNIELLDIIKKTKDCDSIQDVENVSKKRIVKNDVMPNYDKICNHKIAHLKDKLIKCNYNNLGEQCDIIESEIPSMNTCYKNQFNKEFSKYNDSLDSEELDVFFKYSLRQTKNIMKNNERAPHLTVSTRLHQ